MTPISTNAAYTLRIRTIAIIALSAISLTGCRYNHCGRVFDECFGDCIARHRAKANATQAWDCSSHCNKSEHVRAGFIDGYVDVALGGRGCTPAVAPSRYWSWRYPGIQGQRAGTDWLAGYPMGAMAGRNDGMSNRVAALPVAVPNPVSMPVNIQPAVPTRIPVQQQGVEPLIAPGADTIDGTIEFNPRDYDSTDIDENDLFKTEPVSNVKRRVIDELRQPLVPGVPESFLPMESNLPLGDPTAELRAVASEFSEEQIGS